jgi:hypothetical protein
MGRQVCSDLHAPYDCSAFLRLNVSQRQQLVRQGSWCTLCFRHYDTARCPLAGKQPCLVAGCGRGHHSVLHQEREDRQVNAITAHEEQGEKLPGSTLHLPRQTILMGTPWCGATATVLWDMAGTSHLITHDFAHQLKCVAMPGARYVPMNDGKGYFSSCRYVTYLNKFDGCKVMIEAAGVEQIASEHEARTPGHLAERFPTRGLRGWWLDQPAAEIDVMLSTSLLNKEEVDLTPKPLEASALEED